MMRICDLQKALNLSKERADAIDRLKKVNEWPFQLSPIYITVERLSIMVNNRGAFDTVKKVLIDLLQEEIADKTNDLRDLGAVETE